MSTKESWRIAYDNSPDDPNPHPWDLSVMAFGTFVEAEYFVVREEDDLRHEYGDDYAAEFFRWLIVRDTQLEVNVNADSRSDQIAQPSS